MPTQPNRPFTPGINWKPERHKLYRFSEHGVTVIRPWPAPQAWYKSVHIGWRPYSPLIDLSCLDGARNAGIGSPTALGVTILTSDPTSEEELMKQRIDIAKDSGCLGLVCSAHDLSVVSRQAPDLLAVVPGIRPSGVQAHDQKKMSTPSKALDEGAGLLVIGRAVTLAENPTEAAEAIHEEIADS